jgi:hypothetical protein
MRDPPSQRCSRSRREPVEGLTASIESAKDGVNFRKESGRRKRK